MKRKNSYKKGLWAEHYAGAYLFLKGYRLLEKRYKTPFGEIDLLAKKGTALICVEVKYRANAEHAIEAVNRKTQQRIVNAAEFFRAHHPRYTGFDVRFDVVTVTPFFALRHHKNAWYST